MSRITEAITDAFDRVRPGPRVPPARKRAAKSEALTGGTARIARSKLQEQRDELAREFVGLQWDLGGVAYEMAIRDHFRLDVIVKLAAGLQQVDSSLGQVERMLRLEQDGVAGTCPSCGGVQARGAVFCWQCGNELTPSTTVAAPGGVPGHTPPTTAELEAEFAPASAALPNEPLPLSSEPAAADSVPLVDTREPQDAAR